MSTNRKFRRFFMPALGFIVIGLLAMVAAFLLGLVSKGMTWLFMHGWNALCILGFILALSSCSLTVPVTATGNPMGVKTGHATATTVFGICINGDASVQTAALSGGIDRITTVDFKTQNFLWIVQRHTCLVRGQ